MIIIGLAKIYKHTVSIIYTSTIYGIINKYMLCIHSVTEHENDMNRWGLNKLLNRCGRSEGNGLWREGEEEKHPTDDLLD